MHEADEYEIFSAGIGALVEHLSGTMDHQPDGVKVWLLGLRQDIRIAACLQVVLDGHGEHWMGVGRASEEVHPLLGGGDRAGELTLFLTLSFRSSSSSDEIGARQTKLQHANIVQMKRVRLYCTSSSYY